MFSHQPLRILLPTIICMFALLACVLSYVASRAIITSTINHDQLVLVHNQLSSWQVLFESMLRKNEYDAIRQNVSLYGTSPDHDILLVTDYRGKIMASSLFKQIGHKWSKSDGGDKIDPEMVKRIIKDKEVEVRLSEDGKWIEGYAPVCMKKGVKSNGKMYCGFIYYRQNLSYHKNRAFAEMKNMGILTGIGILLSSFILWILLHILLFRRTGVLINVLSSYRVGDKKVRTNMGGKDEIGLIGSSVDQLLDIISEDEKRLSASETRFRTLVGNIPGAVFRCKNDEQRTIIFISSGISGITGHNAEALHGDEEFSYFGLVYDEDIPMVEKIISEGIRARRPFIVEYRVVNAQSNIRWVSMRGRGVTDSSGEISFFDAVIIDITENRNAEQKVRDREEMLDAMSQASKDAITIIDSRDEIIFWNKAAEHLFGFTAKEVIGRKKLHSIITLPEDQQKALAGMDEFRQSGTGEVLNSISELQAIKKNGEVFPVERAVAAFQMGGAWYAVGSIRDITERKKNEEELRRIATIDSLTGLTTRRHFLELAEQHLHQALRYSIPFCVCMFDVDHFKKVNDTYGHNAGDLVLAELSRLSISIMRETDVLGRIGGEEFAISMLHTTLPEAINAVERLRFKVEENSVITDKKQVYVTISAGVAQLSGKEQSIGDLLKIADEALYEAKNSGRNRVVTGGMK